MTFPRHSKSTAPGIEVGVRNSATRNATDSSIIHAVLENALDAAFGEYLYESK